MFGQMPMNMQPIYSGQVVQVNGENGARAFQMLPNASVLLLDSTAPLIWLAQTDGAGYKTVTPYKIEKDKPPQPPDINALMERLERLEGKLNESNTTDFARTAETTEWYAPTVITDTSDTWKQSEPVSSTDVAKQSTVPTVRQRK